VKWYGLYRCFSAQRPNPIAVSPRDSLKERLASLGNDFAKFADKLETEDKVTTIFPNPSPNRLDIIVQTPIIQAGESVATAASILVGLFLTFASSPA
jgi:hypothetical protein